MLLCHKLMAAKIIGRIPSVNIMENLEEYRIVIVGVGGIGIRIAKDVGRILEHQAPFSCVVLVDGDHYEPKNKNRQEFKNLGNKAEVLAQEINEEFPDTFILPQAKWVVSDDASIAPDKEEEPDKDLPKANDTEEAKEGEVEKVVTKTNKIRAKDLLEEGDIVFAVVDNFAARAAIFNAARNFNNIDVLSGGNDDELFGSVYHYRRRNGEDVIEHPAERHDDLVNPPDKNPGELSCQERAKIEGGEQTIAANAGVAALLTAKMHLILHNKDIEIEETSEIFIEMGKGLAAAHNRSTKTEILEGV